MPKITEKCISCGLCVHTCVNDAIVWNKETIKPEIRLEECLGCFVCSAEESCPALAIELWE